MVPFPPPVLLNEQGLDALVKSIEIPPRPRLLAEVQQEMASDDPDPRKIARLVSKDVAMSAALLKMANSVFFGLKHKAETIEQAAAFLGLTQCSSLLMGLITRKAINAEGPLLDRFWDVSTKRSLSMVRLAKVLRTCAPDVAHTFGLFCDIGIPLLMKRFPDYVDTLEQANADCDNLFTASEDNKHNTNHTIIGSILADSWGLSNEVTFAIREHHNYGIMQESMTPKIAKSLIALALVAERAIQLYEGLNHHVEWEKGGELALDVLNISEEEMIGLCDELHVIFSIDN